MKDMDAAPDARVDHRYSHPHWTRQELILALDLYLRSGPVGSSSSAARVLSEQLRSLNPEYAAHESTYRNANSVALRLANFAALDPEYPGRAMRRTGQEARDLWNEFGGNQQSVAEEAETIRSRLRPAEVQDAIAAAEEIGHPLGVGRGQGWRQSAEERRAIELHAMEAATDYLESLSYRVEDVSATQSYDLDCWRDSEHLSVEVKGTTSQGARVLLTRNEVLHARASHPDVALIVVSNITLSRGDELRCAGGLVFVVSPWDVDDEALEAISYEYVVPRGD